MREEYKTPKTDRTSLPQVCILCESYGSESYVVDEEITDFA